MNLISTNDPLPLTINELIYDLVGSYYSFNLSLNDYEKNNGKVKYIDDIRENFIYRSSLITPLLALFKFVELYKPQKKMLNEFKNERRLNQESYFVLKVCDLIEKIIDNKRNRNFRNWQLAHPKNNDGFVSYNDRTNNFAHLVICFVKSFETLISSKGSQFKMYDVKNEEITDFWNKNKSFDYIPRFYDLINMDMNGIGHGVILVSIIKIRKIFLELNDSIEMTNPT